MLIVNSIGLELDVSSLPNVEKVTGPILLIHLGLGPIIRVDGLLSLPSMDHGGVFDIFPMKL